MAWHLNLFNICRSFSTGCGSVCYNMVGFFYCTWTTIKWLMDSTVEFFWIFAECTYRWILKLRHVAAMLGPWKEGPNIENNYWSCYIFHIIYSIVHHRSKLLVLILPKICIVFHVLDTCIYMYKFKQKLIQVVRMYTFV